MKTLMIATEKLPVPPIRGGAIQTYMAAVAPRLAQKGIDLTILGVADPDLPEDERRDGVRFVRVPGGTLEGYRQSVVSFLAKEHFDRIHVFNRPKLVLPVREAAPQTPISLSLHNEMFLPRKIEPEEARQVVATVDGIATVSDFIGKGISDPYPGAAGKLRTIYSGVDAEAFVPGWSSQGRSMRQALRKQHGLSDKRVVLFVGRLSPKKGADILLLAMELVAKEIPDVALVLVGSKWYGADELTDFVAYLQNLAARSPVPIVTTGFITPDQVNQWFAAGDLFVCPSVWKEPLARVHYEAMAAGLPIVTTRRGGNPEVVESTGIGVVVDDPESPEAMAKAILGLLKSSSRREAMAQAGRSLALERFNWDRVAADILALWTEAPVATESSAGAQANEQQAEAAEGRSESAGDSKRRTKKSADSERRTKKSADSKRRTKKARDSEGRTKKSGDASVRTRDAASRSETVRDLSTSTPVGDSEARTYKSKESAREARESVQATGSSRAPQRSTAASVSVSYRTRTQPAASPTKQWRSR